MVEELVDVARAAHAAPHGGKAAVYDAAAARLGVSRATLLRRLHSVAVRPQRKRRADAGQFALPRPEAEVLSAYLQQHFRGNGKRSINMDKALEDLRANGLISATRIDTDTGEVLALSASAVARALRGYGLHPEQLRRLPAAQQQSTPHPNHTWQMDASVCTLFYLDDDGTRDMPANVFYKNKPENFERVARKRVTRFVITDHTSGALKVRYFLGGESEANFAEFFLWAMDKQGGNPMHGVPLQLMVDPGSGMAGAFKNLVRRLRIKLIVNAPGNPRAKGQVENAQNLVEMGFESQFRAHRPAGLAELNARAQVWADRFNARAVHGRHGKTRAMKWMEITAEQLRTPPAMDVRRQLLTAADQLCKVNQFKQVQFGGGGRFWDVRHVPGVEVGEKLAITFNAYNDREVFAVLVGADGQERLEPCPLVERDANGFTVGAPVIGNGYVALPDTAGDVARKRAELLATGAPTLKQAAAKRKRRDHEVFNGAVRFDHLERELAELPSLLPRRGTPLQPTVQAPAAAAEPRLLTHFEAARELKDLGVAMNEERVSQLRAWHPEGVPEDQLASLQHRLTVRAGLRVVGGVAANE